MSQGELITAYQRGVISRRGFVRGLVSLGATMAFANQLADQVAAAPAEQAAPRAFSSDIYDGGGGGITGIATAGIVTMRTTRIGMTGIRAVVAAESQT